MKSKIFFLVFACILVLFSMSVYSTECDETPSENCVVSTDTTFYTSTYYFNDTDANGGIVITGSNIVLNCNNSILNGNESTNSIAINFSDSFNVTIRGCNITGYDIGIKTEHNATGHYLTDNTIRNADIGYYISGSNSTINDTQFINTVIHYSFTKSTNYKIINNRYNDTWAVFNVTDIPVNFTVNETSKVKHNITLPHTGNIVFAYDGRKDFHVHRNTVTIENMQYPNNYVLNLNNNLTLASNVSTFTESIPKDTYYWVGDLTPQTEPITVVINLTLPLDGYVHTNTTIILNWTILGKDYDLTSINLTLNDTITAIGVGNCTSVTDIKKACSYNYTTLVASNEYIWNITVFTNTTNTSSFSDSSTFKVDRELPRITEVANWSITDSVISYRFLVNDYSPDFCEVQILQTINSTGVNVTSVSGTLGPTSLAGNTNCTGTINASDVNFEGDFKLRYRVSDELGNENFTNQSGIKIDVFEGWNLVTWAAINSTGGSNNVFEICDSIANCDQVSWQNNSNGSSSFTTYDTTTPSVNNDTLIAAGDAFLVHVTADATVFGHDSLPTGYNIITLWNNTWNTMGLIVDTNMSAIYSAKDNASGNGMNITFASWNNESKWITCRRSVGLCAGTGSTPSGVELLAGHAVWVLLEDMAVTNISINRTGISG